MPHRPRSTRDYERARRAAAQAEGQSATNVALARIGAAFDEAAAVNAFKLRVERTLRLGPNHAAVRARFSGRAGVLKGGSLDAAIALAGRWWRDERRAFQIASALGRGNRLSLEVLRELRLILRLIRRKRMQAELCSIVAALCDEAIAAAAE
jgi:hypothetical protein